MKATLLVFCVLLGVAATSAINPGDFGDVLVVKDAGNLAEIALVRGGYTLGH